jgi:DNA-binding NarL/FixJ family response regulator
MKYGASGYLLKDTSYDSIIDSIKSVYNGSIVVHPEIASKLIENIEDKNKADIDTIMKNFRLTQREVEIIAGIGSGLTNKEIGDKLYITEGTVKNYISDILSKLELRDRTQIAIFALKNSLV